jgi:predicted nucleic acid-binding protein
LEGRTKARPLAFVDTNVLIRGLTLPRFPYEVLRAGALGQVQLITFQTTLAKARYYTQTRFPAQLQRFERFLDTGVLGVVENPSESAVRMYPDLVRDEDDIPVALAAIQAGAEYLVSTDPDLIETRTWGALEAEGDG